MDASKIENELRQLIELSSRIDERLRNLIEASNATVARLDRAIDRVGNIDNRVGVLEIKQAGSDSKWKAMLDVGLKVTATLVGGAMLWKLGLPH